MSFQQGLSGLNAAAKSLDVIGNNVANSTTVGFKQSRAEFSDVYAASLS
ncbi:MAG: flagellar basal body protein, partial [Sulfuricella sp.]